MHKNNLVGDMEDKHELLLNRFSDLPDGVVHQVLSFMNFRDSIRVGSLSKRCGELYLSTLSLKFRSRHKEFTGNSKLVLLNSIDRYLIHRGCNKIQSLSVRWNMCDPIQTTESCEAELYRVMSWIHTALRCNVEVLDLQLSMSMPNMPMPSFVLPSSIFLCRSLRSLTVDFDGFLKLPSSSSINIKCLRLRNVTIDMEFGKWISCCSKFLEELRFSNVTATILNHSVETFKPNSLAVTHLKILNERVSEDSHMEWVLKVFHSICSIKTLTLTEDITKAIFREGFVPRLLDDVVSFCVRASSFNDDLVPAMVSLLTVMPNLKRLYIKSQPTCCRSNLSPNHEEITRASGINTSYWESQNLACVDQLEWVKMKLSDGENELEFARYLLEHATNLKTMVIVCLCHQSKLVRVLNESKKSSTWKLVIKKNKKHPCYKRR